jgi:hypothetical protein
VIVNVCRSLEEILNVGGVEPLECLEAWHLAVHPTEAVCVVHAIGYD